MFRLRLIYFLINNIKIVYSPDNAITQSQILYMHKLKAKTNKNKK